MKVSKVFSAAVIASAMLATVADAGSIGRSGGSSGGGRSSSSFSSSSSASKSSSFPSPSKPAAAPAPTARPGGIGGNTQGSAMGVRKSEVTAPVAQQVRPSTPSTTPGYSNSSPSYGSAPAPNYAPSYSAPAPVIGGGFGSSFAGALGGTLIGNALFGNHGHSGGTTVVNNGSGGYSQGGSAVQSAPATVVDSNGQVIQQPGTVVVQQKASMGMGTIILNVILFAILIAVIAGVAILFYKGFKMLKEYVNKERGVKNEPFSPTARFWEIQRAFAAADVPFLKTLLGPDLFDEATNGLQASTLTLSGVSHEVRLNNNAEFSVWYTFTDAGDQVNQVWHYEKFGKEWLLNGIETV